MCLLCGEPERGELGPLLSSVHCHQLCLKFSSGLRARAGAAPLPKDVEVVREVKRCRKVTCVYCKRRGAATTCAAEECSRTFHLGCGLARGAATLHPTSSAYCSNHRPYPALTCPAPRPACPLCCAPVSPPEVLQCPACSVYLDRACLDRRAATGLAACPSCHDAAGFRGLLEGFGVWFRDAAADRVLASASSGAPSPTIAYLMKEVIVPSTAKAPPLVINKLSPMNQHLAAQKTRPVKVMKVEEPIVRLTATRSPSKARGSDSEVVEVGGWLSTPGAPTSARPAVPRKTRSLPSKAPRLTSPNHLISSFFKPVARPAGGSSSEVEVVEPASKDTSAKDTSGQPTRASSPARAPPSPRKPISPFKTIRMCPPLTKVVRPVMKLEYSSGTGTEGPLSDIDDILTGAVPDLDSHPLADIVFRPSNPHLKDILKRIKPEVDKVKKVEKSRESTPAYDEDDEKTAEQADRKKKERKVPDKKVKPEVQRKKVLKKVSDARRSGSGSEGSERPRQRALVRKLPLSARQIYHGRSWVPMTRFGEGESEEECECSWVMDYTGHKLEDIVDLNAAEKAMMNLWNKHVNKYQGRGMTHMDAVVMDFLAERSHTIVELNLYRNFVSHLVTLHQASVLTGETMYRAIGDIQDVMRVLDETATVVVPVWEEQQRRALARMREEEELPAASSPSRMVSSLLGGLATVVTLLARSAGRCRPNSSLAGGGRASPGQASPARGAPSPSRPSTSSSIGRGRRSSTWSRQVQRSLELEPRSLDFDLPSPPTAEPFHLANQTTPTRKGREGREGAVLGTDSGGDTSASEAGREVASFLTTFPAINAEDKEEEEDFEVHVLTEEPDSEDLEEVEEVEMEGVEEEVEVAAETVHRRSSRVMGLGEQEKDFRRLQEEERRSTLERAREKDPGGTKVAVFYIGDEIIKFAEDRLVKVVEECPRVTALRNLYMKQQQKRKRGQEGPDQTAKRARLE